MAITKIQLQNLNSLTDENWYPITDVTCVEGLDNWINSKKYLTESSLADYAKTSDVNGLISTAKTELEGKISAVESKIPSLNGYATEEYVTGAIADLNIDDYALKSELPTDFYSKSEVDSKVANVKSEILGGAGQDYDTLKEIETWIGTHQELYQALVNGIATKATKDELDAAVEDMATQTWVKAQNYLTSHQSLDNYYDKEEIDDLFDEFDISDQLENYYTKDVTYTKAEVNAEIEKAIEALKKLIGVKASLV